MTYTEMISAAKAIKPGASQADAIRILGRPDREADDIISYDLTKVEGFPGTSASSDDRVFFAIEMEILVDRVKQVQFAWIDTKD